MTLMFGQVNFLSDIFIIICEKGEKKTICCCNTHFVHKRRHCVVQQTESSAFKGFLAKIKMVMLHNLLAEYVFTFGERGDERWTSPSCSPDGYYNNTPTKRLENVSPD